MHPNLINCSRTNSISQKIFCTNLAATLIHLHEVLVCVIIEVTQAVAENVHIIPVGFDYERLFQPISQGNLEADRIYLLDSPREDADEELRRIAENMLEKLEDTFERVLGKTVERHTVEDIFEFEKVYPEAYKMIEDEVKQENEVWINISSMPRTVAFAFATAANSLVVEEPELRDKVHTYYVSPDEYLVIRMIKQLRKERGFLEDLAETQGNDRIEERLEAVDDLVSEIDNSGVTKGASKMNGGLHVEFPVIPPSDLHDFEKEVLQFLYQERKTESTSALARKLADELGEESTDSFKSKVLYNVNQLEKKGFIHRTEVKNKYETELSTMGELWIKTHQENNSQLVV